MEHFKCESLNINASQKWKKVKVADIAGIRSIEYNGIKQKA
jgi:hypothetical protein